MGWWSVAEYKAINHIELATPNLPYQFRNSSCFHVLQPSYQERRRNSSWLLVQSLGNHEITTTSVLFLWSWPRFPALCAPATSVANTRLGRHLLPYAPANSIPDIVWYCWMLCITNCPVQTPKWGKHGQTSVGLQDQLFVLDPISLQHSFATSVCPHTVSVFSKMNKRIPD